MEQNQGKKFVCKFCNKGYPCGKSLGGHIRTHMNTENLGEAEEKAEISINNKQLLCSRNIKRAAEAEAGVGQSATYDIREKPKKSKRFSDLGNGSVLKEMICKECGKGFQSLKALCGHIACHSDKERVFQKLEDHWGNTEKQKLVVDSQSDTEISTPSRRRRSKRIRCKTGGVYSNNSVSLANGSSSVSEIEEQEQEEVAMCLMMLSRDSGCKKGLNSVADSSDNNSVVLEAKSSSIDLRITVKNANNGGELLKMKKQGVIKLKSAESGPCSENSDPGYFRNGPKKVEPDVSSNGVTNNVECKKLKVKSRSGFEDFDATLGKSRSKFKYVKTEFPKDLVSEVGDNQDDRALTKYGLRSGKNDYSSSPKGTKLESIHDRGEDSLANGSFHAPMAATKLSNGSAEKRLGSKKNKGHVCPFCFRVFKSGQALGGHKRSHFADGSEDTTLVIKRDSPDMPLPALIDLNLPAPLEEDAMENSGFIPW
ncbi:hypothetical protein Goarm_000541 [Gossypium armourianum]|uniref:C2H2-type domain-containing protein n=1 Tax=Gossypium armourianum TaxID=34283 RepID=A0A7J9KA78_9ROSI|nr:hypothetical protein [Gossypium armourianum]